LKSNLRFRLGSMGYLLIIAGVLGGPALGLWLLLRGDIIDMLHRAKMSLPGWGWTALKYVLSFAFGVTFAVFLMALGMFVLAWGNRGARPPREKGAAGK